MPLFEVLHYLTCFFRRLNILISIFLMRKCGQQVRSDSRLSAGKGLHIEVHFLLPLCEMQDTLQSLFNMVGNWLISKHHFQDKETLTLLVVLI